MVNIYHYLQGFNASQVVIAGCLNHQQSVSFFEPFEVAGFQLSKENCETWEFKLKWWLQKQLENASGVEMVELEGIWKAFEQ